MSPRLVQAFVACAVLTVGLWVVAVYLDRTKEQLTGRDAAELAHRREVRRRIQTLGGRPRREWRRAFARAGLEYPPDDVRLVAIKADRRLDVIARRAGGEWTAIRSYPILGPSGDPGPKLREDDGQVPEGIYSIESVQPRGRRHVALRIGYPNLFDQEQAARDGRTRLGGDITIHGGTDAAGGLAMGDPAAEDLFVLAWDTGLRQMAVLIAPVDFRRQVLPPDPDRPAWTSRLYDTLRTALAELPPPTD